MLLLKQWRFQIWRICRLVSIRGALTTLFTEAQRQKYRGTTKYYISRRPGEEAWRPARNLCTTLKSTYRYIRICDATHYIASRFVPINLPSRICRIIQYSGPDRQKNPSSPDAPAYGISMFLGDFCRGPRPLAPDLSYKRGNWGIIQYMSTRDTSSLFAF